MSKYTPNKTETSIRHHEQVNIALKLKEKTNPPFSLAWFAENIIGTSKQNFNARLKKYYPKLDISELNK